MITEQEIAAFNMLLGDSCGLTKYGEPKYKWMRAGDMKFVARKGTKWVDRSGLSVPEPEMALFPMLPMCEDCQWVLTMWTPPSPLSEWQAMHGTEMGYPERGLYYQTDCILSPGIDPTEGLTREAIGAIKTVREMNEFDFRNMDDAKRERSEREHENQIDDILRDKMTAFGNVPGSRGGLTSFPEARPGFAKQQ